MKCNSKGRNGFVLIEVIISMMILGIISIGVYEAYILAIRNVKEGQVKQSAALEGKRLMEEIKSIDIAVPNTTFVVGDNTFVKFQKNDGSIGYKRYLDESFKEKNDNETDITEDERKYSEIITLNPTKTDDPGYKITFDNNEDEKNTEDINYRVDIIKESSVSGAEDYIYEDETEFNDKEKIVLYMYIEDGTNNTKNITITDFNGNEKLKKNLSLGNSQGKVNIYVNFREYEKINELDKKPVIINIYNKMSEDIPNIYLEKSNSIDAKIENHKGKINLYDNRAEDSEKAISGTLYDVKVEIRDYLEDKNKEAAKDEDNLFTGYYNQNVEEGQENKT